MMGTGIYDPNDSGWLDAHDVRPPNDPKTATNGVELTYDDLLKAAENMGSEYRPKVFVFHPTTIAYLYKNKYIRKDGERMFLVNVPYPMLNGAEVFASEDIPTSKHGYEVSKIIYDEFGEGSIHDKG